MLTKISQLKGWGGVGGGVGGRGGRGGVGGMGVGLGFWGVDSLPQTQQTRWDGGRSLVKLCQGPSFRQCLLA